MKEINELITNSQLVTEYFGYWPTFHDSEIINISLEREGVTARMKIYVFNLLDEVNEQGAYKKDKECYITLKLNNITEISMSNFNHQNVIEELNLEEKLDQIHFLINSSFGLYGEITCSEILVESLERIHHNK